MAGARTTAALLDASAIVALLAEEPGSDAIEPHLDDAAVLSVNLAEVVKVLARRGLSDTQIRTVLFPLGLREEAFTPEMAWHAGRHLTQLPAGLGIADACCLAAARVLRRVAVTTDKHWRKAAATFDADVIVIAPP